MSLDFDIDSPAIPKKKRTKKVVVVAPVVEPVVVPTPKKTRIKKIEVMQNSSSSDDLSPPTESISTVSKNNKWLVHIREYRKMNPEVSYKDAMKQAKTTYNVN